MANVPHLSKVNQTSNYRSDSKGTKLPSNRGSSDAQRKSGSGENLTGNNSSMLYTLTHQNLNNSRDKFV